MRSKDQIILESCYLQIIEEGRKQRYMVMFNKFFEDYTNRLKKTAQYESSARRNEKFANELLDEHGTEPAKQSILSLIEGTLNAFKNNEKAIVWFLKQYRKKLYSSVIKNDNYYVTLRQIIEGLQDITTYYIREYATVFEHLLSLPIPEIQNYESYNDDKMPGLVIGDMNHYERTWINQNEEQKQWIDITSDLKDGDIEKIVQFENGFAWFNLKTPSCSKEGKSMGHCGNSPRSNTKDTILSLRKVKKENYKTWGGSSSRVVSRPSLTFILDEKGFLGEMKGRGNTKPKEEYHPYIVSLLTKTNFIKGIEGGGYAPERNFSLYDLNVEELTKLFETKPDFIIKGYEAEKVLRDEKPEKEDDTKNTILLSHLSPQTAYQYMTLILKRKGQYYINDDSYERSYEDLQLVSKLPEQLFKVISKDRGISDAGTILAQKIKTTTFNDSSVAEQFIKDIISRMEISKVVSPHIKGYLPALDAFLRILKKLDNPLKSILASVFLQYWENKKHRFGGQGSMAENGGSIINRKNPNERTIIPDYINQIKKMANE